MEEKNLFAGIFIENATALAAVVSPPGKPILCGQYRYASPSNDLPEIIGHLTHFADLQEACLRMALAQRWDDPLPLQHLSHLNDEIIRVTHRDLAQIGLARFSYESETLYDKAKLLALLAALRYATKQEHLEESFREGRAA